MDKHVTSVRCFPLFASKARQYNISQERSLSDAVSAAIEDCISKGYLESYFREKRAEVSDMILTDWDAELQREQDRQEGFEDGFEAGCEQGIEQGIEQGLAQSIAQLREAGLTEAVDLLEQTKLAKA